MGNFIMKKLIMAVALLLTSSLSYAEPYTHEQPYKCTAYVNGEAVHSGAMRAVMAFKSIVAEEKEVDRLKRQGLIVDYVKCKKFPLLR
jgi:hypothetical protein